jgi:uncharacterized damage-inducible protein DinB
MIREPRQFRATHVCPEVRQASNKRKYCVPEPMSRKPSSNTVQELHEEDSVKLQTFGVAAAMLVLTTLRPAAQSPTIQSDALKDWTNMKETMTKIADAMPEDKFGFKPTPAQRTFGEQILHVAGANVGLIKMLGGKAAAPTVNAKATSKAEILKALADSYDYGIAVIKEQTDQAMLEAVKGPSFIGTATRARLVWATIGHAWDEYGAMTVYLRLNGIVPPASRGM